MPEPMTRTAETLRAEFLHLAAAAKPWRVDAPHALLIAPDPEPEEETRAARRRRQREEGEGRGGPRLLALLGDARLYFDPAGQTYIEIDGEMFLLDAKHPRLVETVAALYYRATGQTAGKDTLAAAVAVLSYAARREGSPAIMANRAAYHGGALWYDLGNRRAARIAGGAWRIVAATVGLFRPWPHKLPHPDPITPGNAGRLFEFINVPTETRPFVLATLAACLVPGISRPALVITGPQGSGKSTVARFFKRLVDPGNPALTMIPRKPDDLDLLLARNFFLALDNLSSLMPDVADTLSGVITGAAPQRRKLHSDAELLTLVADLTLCFTSINSLSDRADFLERTLRVQLERIEDDTRQADDDLETAFSAALPEILGGLLSLVAAGLERLPTYRPPRLPRMAQFARLAAAIAEAQEKGAGGRYLAEFFRNQGAQHLELAEGNPFFAAILETCARHDYPAGGFKEVCAKLKEIANPDPKDRFPTPRGFRKAVERLRVPLETAGIGFEIDSTRTAHEKATIRFFPKPRAAELAAEAAIEPVRACAAPDLSGLTFDAGELDP
ncbi:hypothetical protein [Geoalkalibacter sp.]|uniref:hypothetical protein n=1 Tax=Geoalkalibacter sp. TaxID=3041440 RepID=UPI00272E1EB5|nr:hypothetical protein [Geoalkalibacter sp.]